MADALTEGPLTTGADLEIRGLTKQFGTVTAVDGVDLTVPAGSFFALLGPSGCGKTTTLRMVAGLEDPTAGVIRIGGGDVTHAPAHRRPVNTVFQSYALFPHLSVLENVAFGLRRRHQPRPRTSAMAALELVELSHVAHRRPSQLSGGQQQRVALARAIVNQPAVLLLDEPLGALDLKLRRQMQVELKQIQTEVGLTFIHVTHDQEEAMTMADTVAVMNHGRIEQLGAPEELYEHPRTAFVANFLGQSTLIPARVVSNGGGVVTVRAAAGAPWPLRLPVRRMTTTSGDVVVGIRPEKLVLRPGGPQDVSQEVNALGPGRVTDVSFAGVATQYLVDVPGLGEVGVFSQNLGQALAHPGDHVHVTWAPEHSFGLAGDQDVTAGREET